MVGDNTLQRRTVLRTIGGSLAATGLLAGSGSVSADGSSTRHAVGGREYTKYVPNGVDESPLLVMLHGCTQDADQFSTETEMNQVADTEGFVVAYPEQSSSANLNRCWNWFEDENTTRDSGEASIIVDIVDDVRAAESIDEQRIYLAGLSAGAAMIPNLLAEYPDVFAAGAVHAGLEYDAADDTVEATMAMNSGGPDPEQQGVAAYEAMAGYGVSSPIPTLVVHGTDDTTVDPVNGHQATEQAVVTNDLAITGEQDGTVTPDPDEIQEGESESYSYTIEEYHAEGTAVVEKLLVEGMGHAWTGGAQGGAYTAPGGPDGSQLTWEFLSRWTRDDPLENGEDDDGDDGDDGDDDDGDNGDDDDGDDSLFCGPATNAEHVDAGRAYASWGCYYATGSHHYLGCMSIEENTLEETSTGYFEAVESCS